MQRSHGRVLDRSDYLAGCLSAGHQENLHQLRLILLTKAPPDSALHRSRSLGGFAVSFHFALFRVPPLSRGSDGRFGLRRFRAKLTPTPFRTHRAFTHALPPSFGLRSVPFTVPPCFFPLPL